MRQGLRRKIFTGPISCLRPAALSGFCGPRIAVITLAGGGGGGGGGGGLRAA